MIITISGVGGSGKSTVARLIAKKMGYKHHSVGDLQREIAEEKGMSIKELGELEAKDKSIDNMMDAKMKELGEKEDNFVIDGWLTAKFIVHAFNVFLDCELEERAGRIAKAKRNAEDYRSTEEAKKSLVEREECNRERWLRYYDFDFMEKKNYDLVIDTTDISAEQVAEKIVEKAGDFS